MDDARARRKAGWRLMREAVRAHRGMMILGILAGLLWAAARVAVPALAGAAVNRGVAEADWTAARNWMLLILAVGAVQAICTGIRRYAAFGLAWRVERDLRMRLVAHLQTLHFAFHDRAQTGQLMAYANTDIQQINNVVLLIPLTIASSIQMVAVAVILLLAEPGPRVLRARARCRCSTSPRRGSATACSRSDSRCKRSCPSSRASSRRASPASGS